MNFDITGSLIHRQHEFTQEPCLTVRLLCPENTASSVLGWGSTFTGLLFSCTSGPSKAAYFPLPLLPLLTVTFFPVLSLGSQRNVSLKPYLTTYQIESKNNERCHRRARMFIRNVQEEHHWFQTPPCITSVEPVQWGRQLSWG